MGKGDGHWLRAVAASSLSAGCLIVSSPGGPLPWLAPIALVPYFVLVGHGSMSARLMSASFIAGSWTAPIAAGLVLRAPWIGIALSAGTATVFGACLFLAARPRLPAWQRLLLFAAVWGAAAGVFTAMQFHARPWPLTAGLVTTMPASWRIVALGGWPLLDAVAISGAAFVCGVMTRRIGARAVGTAAGLGLVLAAGASTSTSELRRVGETPVGLVQGNIDPSLLNAVAISPNDRAIVRQRITDLTDRALRDGAALVVWPENGMGLPVGQVPTLARPFFGRAVHHDAAVLAAGDELNAQGGRPAAWLLRLADPRVLRKVEHVPGLEREGEWTKQPLVTMPAGSLGVLICYDAALPWVVHDVADAGAQALLAPTDNGSYFGSTLTAWQVATSAIAAIEVGRPLLFVANRGPSVLVDPMELTVVPILGPQTEGARVVALPHVVGRTAAAAGGRTTCTVLMLVAAMALMKRGRRTTPIRGHRRVPPMALVVVGVVASMLAGICLGGISSVLLSGSSGGVASKLSVRLARGRAEPAPMSGAAVFRQASEETCGPAALSWALFLLGDWVFEAELARRPGKHNLEELASIAAGRGFETTIFDGVVDDLRPRRDTVYLLHIRPEHFVGCVPSDDGRFAIFDPKPGLVTTVSAEELAEHWSGYAVAITLPTSEAVLEDLKTGL